MAILFDMDGVFLDGPRSHSQVYDDAVTATLATLDIDPTPAQRQALRALDPETVIAECERLGIDPDRYWARRDGHASVGTHDRLRTGARPLYDDIGEIASLPTQMPIGLVTNNRHETAVFVADFLDREFGISFDIVRGREPTPEGFRRLKPDPYYIEQALDELDASEGLYVGDRETDVTAGGAAGLETAFLRRPHNRDVVCPSEATYEIESLSALTRVISTAES